MINLPAPCFSLAKPHSLWALGEGFSKGQFFQFLDQIKHFKNVTDEVVIVVQWVKPLLF